MIKELHLVNCQPYKDALIIFHPGLNVLVGDSDAGKSTVIRSLDKVLFNSMPSKELVSHWGGPLSISIKVDDNDLILKNDGKDSYQLNGTSFSAIGNKVPEEISTLLNMSDINIQNQIENFFLLNETPGYVASYLNQIANLSQIDSTTKSIKSELNETKRTIEHDKKSLAEKEQTLESYSFLENLKLEIKEAEILEKEKEDTEFAIEVLESIIVEIKSLNAAILKNHKLIELKPTIDEALELKTDIENLQVKINKLSNSINSLQIIEDQLKVVSKLSHLKPLINNAIKLKKKKSNLEAKLDDLSKYLNKVSTINKELKLAISKRESEHKLYHSELQKLDKCFFCGSKLNKK